MKTLLSRNSNFLITFLTVLAFASCKKQDCEPTYHLPGGGGSGFVNDNYMEFGAGYGKEVDELNTLLLDNVTWLDNTLWALRNRISVQNLNLILNDTLVLESQPPGQATSLSAFFNTFEADGDFATECYEILELDDFPSWIVLTEHHADIGQIAGSMQAAFIISEECPAKNDPADPDTIYLRDCHFRAIEFE